MGHVFEQLYNGYIINSLYKNTSSGYQYPEQEEYLLHVSMPWIVETTVLTIRTPNIFATSHLFPLTLLQYFNNSRCAPCTLSTTSSVFASIRCIISDCSLTMAANC